ncbi:hypothetical protein Q1695_016341 [Nippostrongylus brasiliensis]|nr:hypothetical protein Q1695_016341 [Nippostrongylus brasiliensis]
MRLVLLAAVGMLYTNKTSPVPIKTSAVPMRSTTPKQNNTGVMYAMAVHEEAIGRPSISHRDDAVVIIGRNVGNITEVWLHPSPTCPASKDKRSVQMTVTETTDNFVVAHMTKIEDFRDEWVFPIFVCSDPSAAPSEFQSIIIVDKRGRHLHILFMIYCLFLFLSALFTGLNLSLMSLDMDDLRRIREYDENPKTRNYAANIIPIRKNGNYMLCTILLGNTICNTICVLTFDAMTGGIILSRVERFLFITVLPALFIIIFSEILPQVICTKYALPIGSRCRHIMVFFMVLTFPASYPLSKILDCIVGKEIRMSYDRRMLSGLMRQQKYDTVNMAEVVENALNLQVRRVRDVMTPLDKVFMLPDNMEINTHLKRQLSENRHTRIPVYKGNDKNDVIGILNVKDLLLIDDSLDIHIGMIVQLWHRSTLFRFVSSEMPVAQLMLELKRGFPLAIVVDYTHDARGYRVIGIVTLEDNLEEVIGEIYDEKDRALEASHVLDEHTNINRSVVRKSLRKPSRKRPTRQLGDTKDTTPSSKEPLVPQNRPIKGSKQKVQPDMTVS